MIAPTPELTPALAGHWARIALGHVGREYPHKPGGVLAGAADLLPPHRAHPIFYGSFDWHSCVHGHWLLATLLRRVPALPQAAAIRQHFDAAFTADKVAGECAFFDAPAQRGFERPYGWAWLLMLAAELARTPGSGWAERLAPLSTRIAARFRAHLPLATYPGRSGAHYNTAFALALAAEWATDHDAALHAALAAAAQRWYGADRDAQCWEPSGDDFLSPTLTAALAMQRLLPPADFQRWFDACLPRLADGEPTPLFTPAVVSDRSDGKIAHLDGLNLSRAWCLQALADALPPGDPRIARLRCSAAIHLDASLHAVAGDYMGEHWLASFALLALRGAP